MRRRRFLQTGFLTTGGIFVPRLIRAGAAYTYHDPSIYGGSGVKPLHSLAVSWAAQVVTNGGAAPSNATVLAISNFCYGLDGAGLTSQMISVNTYAPDNLTAALTPLIAGGGINPWNNTAFVGGDLTIGGLKGDGTTKFLATGVIPSAVYGSVNDSGLTAYITDGSVGSECDIGSEDGSGYQNDLLINYLLDSYFDCYNTTTGRVSNRCPSSYGVGLTSGNRVDSTDEYLYFVSSSGFSTLGGPGGSPGAGLPTVAYEVHSLNNNGASALRSTKRIAFAAIHHGLSSAQVGALFPLVKNLRDSLAGLPTTHHSLVSMWFCRVIGNGGAAPSSATLNALDTFCNALDSAGLTQQMIAVNCLVPDNLIAACTPLIGNTLWTNHNFVSGDLSVNGLVGNGTTKYMQTGIVPSSFLSVNDGGVTAYAYATNASANQIEAGCRWTSTPAEIWFSMNWGGTSYWRCYGESTGGISGTPTGGGLGFISGNRTGASTTYLYGAYSSVPFYSIAGPGGATEGPSPQVEMYAFAWNSNGSMQYPTYKTLSFLAFHHGLTSVQAQALYNAVQALRTTLGGGYV